MSLSQVPREIRQKIFDLAICSRVTPPASPSVTQDGRERMSTDAFDGGGIWNLKPKNPALGLLLVTKQFHDEVQHVQNHITTDYYVDIMFVKDFGLWPTWTVPVLPKNQYINSIDATFRIFDPADDLDNRFQHSLDFRGGCGGPETAIWSFYSLLTNVMEMGPGFLERKADFVVKNIKINVLTPTDGAAHYSLAYKDMLPEEISKEEKRRRRRVRGLSRDESTPAEERLTEYITNGLSMVLHIGYHTMRYGMILWESIQESIVISTNGKEHRRFDVEKLVQDYDPRYWGETPEFIVDRRDKYRQWREWLDVRRQAMKEGKELDGNPPVTYIM
ncbi:hypothetical protein FALBO_14579 [Fusarium albosuccineum]|uniref:F-box domain-containing protein n=1 Tax=Fusarium albosuccineum TaxID=1237068 RepID=A0A8H4KZY6_9HYPO|nr:hypothetical protein FALBO_14579 [Fusarium albosuccineum]